MKKDKDKNTPVDKEPEVPVSCEEQAEVSSQDNNKVALTTAEYEELKKNFPN